LKELLLGEMHDLSKQFNMLNIKPSICEYTTKPKILVCQNENCHINLEKFIKCVTDFSFERASLDDLNSSDHWLKKNIDKFDLIWHTSVPNNDFDNQFKNLIVTVNHISNNVSLDKYKNIVCSNYKIHKILKKQNANNLTLINDFIDLTVFGHDKNFKSRDFKILLVVKEETESILKFLNEIAKPLHNLELKTIRYQNGYKPAVRNALYNECKVALVLGEEEDLAEETFEAAASGCVIFYNQVVVKNYLKSAIISTIPEQFISKILILMNDEMGLYKKSIETSKEVFSFGEDVFIEQYAKMFEKIILKNKGYSFI
jgi:hypothetical protein